MLVETAGAENLALALDSNLSRIAELANGERFTPETAFHMETTLGLPHGFFDQPNPVLTQEVIARLRSPLDILQKDIVVDELDDRSAQDAAASSIAYASPIEVAPTRNNEMATKAQKATATLSSNKRGSAAGARDLTQKAKDHVSKASKASTAELQQSLELPAEPSVPEIRRANLHVLTERNGSKALLSRLLNLSQSNMAHRLHGKKRLDDAEAERITTVLSLPSGWLDVPRETADVPAAVAETLRPSGRRRTTSQSATPAEDISATTIARGDGQGIEEFVEEGIDQADRPSRDPEAVRPEVQERFDIAVSGALAKSQEDASDTTSSPTAPVGFHAQAADTYPSTTMTDLDTLRGIAPIAEALLKTLAGKARTGRLDEGTALRLLQQVVML
ncbi:hypothetical protein [Caballeronia sp. DA-9]|uniref:hypothetical protein n=1 Tax=Caballeronia sp. DA-9 TaxID=3436237 RepID=UPI003F6622D7